MKHLPIHSLKSHFPKANQRPKHSRSGFTIIEVLIVLAIAGLILLIIFVAVPAVNRNQRNNSRTQTVRLISGTLEEFNQTYGSYPSTVSQINQFKAMNPEISKLYVINVRTGAGSHSDYPPMDTIYVEYGHWCNKYGNGDIDTDAIAGDDVSLNFYVIWTLLEPDHPTDPSRRHVLCIDNYDFHP
ncbi:MAG TPA: type II secretion system protein [Candidatus Saccharimonadales bacterium]|nr:type II secretion system protein [Candidatus Saccharimonadales bacterium]